MSKMVIKKIFVVCLALILPIIFLSGCAQQQLNVLETDCVGKWEFYDFWVLDNDTLTATKYSKINYQPTTQIEIVVKEIGDMFNNTILDLSSNKSNDKCKGTFTNEDGTRDISWYCPIEEGLKIRFENLTIYYVGGTKSSPSSYQAWTSSCLPNSSELDICYRTHEFSSYLVYKKMAS